MTMMSKKFILELFAHHYHSKSYLQTFPQFGKTVVQISLCFTYLKLIPIPTAPGPVCTLTLAESGE